MFLHLCSEDYIKLAGIEPLSRIKEKMAKWKHKIKIANTVITIELVLIVIMVMISLRIIWSFRREFGNYVWHITIFPVPLRKNNGWKKFG